MTMRQFFHFAGLQLFVQLIESDAAAGAAREVRVALLALAVFDDVASLGFVGDLELIAGFGNALRVRELRPVLMAALLYGAAVIVKHGANFAEDRAADEEVLSAERAVLNKNGGDRTASRSTRDSSTVPLAGASGLALSSRISATSKIISRS